MTTTKPQHTPGPWKAEQANGSQEAAFFIAGNGLSIAACYGEWHDQAPDNEQEANARLIAAAPEMYEALKELLADTYLRDPINVLRMGKAYLAIQKAEGKTV